MIDDDLLPPGMARLANLDDGIYMRMDTLVMFFEVEALKHPEYSVQENLRFLAEHFAQIAKQHAK